MQQLIVWRSFRFGVGTALFLASLLAIASDFANVGVIWASDFGAMCGFAAAAATLVDRKPMNGFQEAVQLVGGVLLLAFMPVH